MHLISLVTKNLLRRPARSLVTTLGLAIAIAAVVALVGVSESIESSFLNLYSRRGDDLVVQRRGGTVQLTRGIDQKFIERTRLIPGVREVVGSLMDMVAFEEQNLFMVLVNGWELDAPVLDHVTILEGRRLLAGDQRLVMLGRILAANLHKHVGDPITLYGHEFHVAGIFESFSVYESGAVFLRLDELQQEMDRPGRVTGFVVRCQDRSPAAVEHVRQQIEAFDASIVALPVGEFVSALSQMKLARTLSWVMSLIAVVMGAVGVLNTMAMSVFERRGEIAALRAMGWKKSRVIRLVLTEAVLLSLCGAALGTALGIGGVVFLATWPQTAGIVAGIVSLRAVGEGLLIAVCMALIGAAYPAWQSAQRSMIAGLRGV